MANFTLTVGSLSTTNTVDTTKAMAIIGNYITAYDGPVNGTNQQKIDWLLDHLQGHIRETAIGYNRRIAAAAAAAAAEQAEATWE